MTGLWVLIGVLAVATGFGLWFQRANGRVKDAKVTGAAVRTTGAVAEPVPGVAMAGEDDPPAAIEADEPSAETSALAAVLDGRLGEKATMVQFSSAFCQPCRATRRILEEVAVLVPGVSHVEIDAEAHLDLVRLLDIRRTPTVLFLDSAGRVRKHASGQPRKADVIAALGELVPSGSPDFEI
jgi:thiol-disulfide isomerase/thioredoxin